MEVSLLKVDSWKIRREKGVRQVSP